MQIIRSPQELRRAIRRVKRLGKRIGFVPTMGALHEGHLSLIRKAREENDCVVVSLFVNPIQFNQLSDFKAYPRTLKEDRLQAAGAGADLLFVPTVQAIYPPHFQTFVETVQVSRLWEGKSRPGHFRGVTTAVAIFFHLVEPDTVYVGLKDAQQARVIRQMIRDLHFPIRLRALPTVREPDGLAMSSRNRHLSSEARRSSKAIFQALQQARGLIQCGQRRGSLIIRRMKGILRGIPQGRLDYVAIVDPESFEPVERITKPIQVLIACRIGNVRLIDGCLIRPPSRKQRG